MRRPPPRRGRGGRGGGGRPAPAAARGHQPGDDLDLRHRRGGAALRVAGRAAAGRLVPRQRVEDGRRRDVGRAHRDPALLPVVDRYADLRAASNRATAPVPRLSARAPAGGRPRRSRRRSSTAMVASAEAGWPCAAEPPRPRRSRPSRWSPAGSCSGRSRCSTRPDRGPHTDRPELRTAEVACRRAALAWTTRGWPRPTSRWPSGCSAACSPRRCSPTTSSSPSATARPTRGDLDRRRLVRRVPAARRRHGARHRRRHGPRHRGRRGHGPGQDAGPRHRLRPAARSRPGCCAGSTTRWSGLAVPTLATALVCRVEQDDEERAAGLRRLRWSSAGHPEPMLAAADGTVAS